MAEQTAGYQGLRPPLAERMRPRSLDEVVGQRELTGGDAPLRRSLGRGVPQSVLLWGPPGSGKTTIALALAAQVDAAFERLSAVASGIPDLKKVIARAEERRAEGQRTLLFVDEVHRWDKRQQDALLPHIEDGTIIFVGATTENPSLSVNRALMSRVTLYRLNPISEEDLLELARRTFHDLERGLAFPDGDPRAPYELSPEARELLLLHAAGDARALLAALEAASALQPDGGMIEVETLEQALSERRFNYDKAGDQHYDTTSALIKSIRGSDASAAIYWLARMEAGGEDPKFVARRLVIAAGEEVGIAAPGAIAVASAGYDAVLQLGEPECWIVLATITVYLANSPKDWSAYKALGAARRLIAERPQYPVPLHLRNATNRAAREQGHGRGYVHPAETDKRLPYLPEELRGIQIWQPGRRGGPPKRPAGDEG